MKLEKHSRSIAKALSWRFLATLTTILISLFVTGSIAAALSIGSIELVMKIILYYVHERIWHRIPFGRL